MFTGIIAAVGRIASIENRAGDGVFAIDSAELDLDDVELGDSIATQGVCLTAVRLDKGRGRYWADVSAETLARSTLGALKVGDRVNLEKALTPSSHLGGHMVSGHVDGVGELISREDDARSVKLRVRAPDELARYIAQKGSITVDGVSLTTNAVDGAVFDLNIVPHTLQHTSLDTAQVGRRFNLEVDLIARYLERLLLGDAAASQGESASHGVNEALLRERGYLQDAHD